MKSGQLIKQIMLISGTLSVLVTPLLSYCNDKLEQADGNVMIASIDPLSDFSSKKLRQDKEVSGVLDSTMNVDVKRHKQRAVVSSTLELLENLVVEEEKQKEGAVLDLSLNLDLKEQNYYLESDKQMLLQEVFELEGAHLDIQMEAHFEGPHNENKEKDMAPDGLGVSIKLGI